MRYRFVILASLLIFWTESARSAERLRVATEGAYPPFNYLENGELKGFDVDIAKAICARMQYECTLEAVPWSRIIEGLERKDYDLVIASMAFTCVIAA